MTTDSFGLIGSGAVGMGQVRGAQHAGRFWKNTNGSRMSASRASISTIFPVIDEDNLRVDSIGG